MSTPALHSVRKGRQIAVFLDDEPGTLSGIAALLGRHGVNIYALSLAEGIGHGYVRMVVDQPDAALKALREADELVMEREVLLLELANVPGALGEVTRRLAEAKINLEYAYCAGGPNVDRGLVIVRVDHTERALAILQGR
ncbi:MAG TPA: amino acid-binding protein [Kiritimatiellia bacterium]|nr:amino acid-binding protein [Kiritimatiellia bacterium]HRZ11126.1 amino acid-binding protein [Kiritimatiellia bacterium]HSA19502.1 amino acid-binding protein [Kiritimatiellia bacterium]